MSLIRNIPFDSVGVAGWGDTKALQKTPIVLPDTNNSFTPSAKPEGFPGYLSVVPDPQNEKGLVLESALDAYDGIETYGNRSEIYCSEEPVRSSTPILRKYEYDVLIPGKEVFIADDRFFSIQQIHDEPDSGDGARWPNMVMYAGREEFRVMLPKIHPPADGNAANRIAGVAPIIRNHWHTIQVVIKLSMETDGFIEVYVDNRRIVREWQHGTAYNDVEGPNFKLGLYNIFKHTSNVGADGKIAKAYFSACRHYDFTFSIDAVHDVNRLVLD